MDAPPLDPGSASPTDVAAELLRRLEAEGRAGAGGHLRVRRRMIGRTAPPRGLSWTLWLMAAAVACDGGPAPLAEGLVRDSAGVRLVSLPLPGGSEPPISLELDPAWNPAPTVEFGELLDVEILPDGRAILLERYEGRVRVTSRDGRVQAGFGAPGEGPGEFSPGGLARVVASDSSVWVPDLFQQRISEFSLDGTLLGTRRYPGEGVYAVDWRRHPEGGLVFRTLDPTGHQLLRMRAEGIDTIHVFRAVDRPEPNLLLPPVALWDLAGDRLVTAVSDTFAIRSVPLGGTRPTWIARREGEAAAFTQADRTALETVLLASVARAAGGAGPSSVDRAAVLAQVTFPSVRPALAGLFVAPSGDVWVREAASVADMGREALRVGSAEGYGGTDWTVLAADGRRRGRVRLPDGFRVTRVTGGWLYGITADELGLQRPARVGLPW